LHLEPESGDWGGLPQRSLVTVAELTTASSAASAKPLPKKTAARGLSFSYAGGVFTFLGVLQVLIAVVLVLLVLMHSGKDSGLSGAFGVGTGSGPLGGGSMVERNLNRWTVVFAILLFANTIALLKVG